MEKFSFLNIPCKNYPNPCDHSNELESIYEHGVCAHCFYIPDEVIDYYIKTKTLGWNEEVKIRRNLELAYVGKSDHETYSMIDFRRLE